MKIGIITFHRAYNCGAMLQAWALQKVLENMGHEVLFPDNNPNGCEPRFPRLTLPKSFVGKFVSCLRYCFSQALSLGPVDMKRHLHRRFMKQYLHVKECCAADVSKCADIIVCGSDQVFNPKLRTVPYLMQFIDNSVPSSVPRIAYAGSVGDSELSEVDEKRLKTILSSFTAISLREGKYCSCFADSKGRSAIEVLDPTLLLDGGCYSEICSKVTISGQYILMYTLSVSSCVLDIARRAGEICGKKVVILSMYQNSLLHCPRNVRIAFGPSEWLGYFKKADAIIANSFHGTAFALLFNKPFVSLNLCNLLPAESRVGSLLSKIGELDRFVDADVSKDNLKLLLTKPATEESHAKLRMLSRDSISWLEKAIMEV